jgi:hypothetical protein
MVVAGPWTKLWVASIYSALGKIETPQQVLLNSLASLCLFQTTETVGIWELPRILPMYVKKTYQYHFRNLWSSFPSPILIPLLGPAAYVTWYIVVLSKFICLLLTFHSFLWLVFLPFLCISFKCLLLKKSKLFFFPVYIIVFTRLPLLVLPRS